jgi:hypothetical protein
MSETLTLPPVEGWRQSMIRAYRSCPRQLYLWACGEPQVAPYPVLRGTAIHEGAARYVEDLWRRGKSQDKASMAYLAAGYEDLGDVAKMLRRFAEQSTFNWRRCSPFPDRSPVEQRYTAALPNGDVWGGTLDLAWTEPADLVRVVDRATGEVVEVVNPFLDDVPEAKAGDAKQGVIVDWKTGHPKEWVARLTPFQLEGYAYLSWRNHPEAVVSYQVMIGAFHEYKQWKLKPWTVELRDMPAIENRIVSAIERAKADTSFECHVGPACRYCMFIAACPCRDTQTMRQYMPGDAPETIAARMIFYESLAAAEKAKLQRIVREECRPVVCGDRAFDFWPTNSASSKDLTRLDAAYRRRNRRPPATIDADRLGRDLEKDLLLRAEVEDVVNWHEGSRWGDRDVADLAAVWPDEGDGA